MTIGLLKQDIVYSIFLQQNIPNEITNCYKNYNNTLTLIILEFLY